MHRATICFSVMALVIHCAALTGHAQPPNAIAAPAQPLVVLPGASNIVVVNPAQEAKAPIPAAPAPIDLPASVISWDATDKGTNVNFGEPQARYSFALTNVSQGDVTIMAVTTSCGCTTAQLPPMPWKIAPGNNGVINVNMNLAGKNGTVIKTITVSTDKGMKQLLVRTRILPMPTSTAMTPGTRENNQLLSRSDRQAVFKGDCASCHVEPTRNKFGEDLFKAACAICHEAEHRASMVPDLHVARQERTEDFWKNWVTNGRQGSLMPAFSLASGGILSEEQVKSLVDYLVKTMPAKPGSTTPL
jgi:mono/diheme cytochrome c family protein